MRSLIVASLLVATLLASCSSPKTAGTETNTITPAETYKLLGHDTSYVFLDVRMPAEYNSETGHLNGAILIPVDSLENHVGDLARYRGKTVVTYCKTGRRSARAEKILSQHGFQARSMVGGITRWNEEKLPVVKEQK